MGTAHHRASKPGKEDGLPKLIGELQAAEQPGSGLVRSTAMRDQSDPSRVFFMIVFESEEKARVARTTRAARRGSGRHGR